MKGIVTIDLIFHFLFFSFLLNGAFDLLKNIEDNSDIESSSDEEDHDLNILPPTEKTNAETNMENYASVDINDGLVHHLTRGLLNLTYYLSMPHKGNKQKSVQHTQPPSQISRKLGSRNGEKDTDLQPTFKSMEASAVLEGWEEIIKAPIHAFRTIFLMNRFYM